MNDDLFPRIFLLFLVVVLFVGGIFIGYRDYIEVRDDCLAYGKFQIEGVMYECTEVKR